MKLIVTSLLIIMFFASCTINEVKTNQYISKLKQENKQLKTQLKLLKRENDNLSIYILDQP